MPKKNPAPILLTSEEIKTRVPRLRNAVGLLYDIQKCRIGIGNRATRQAIPANLEDADKNFMESISNQLQTSEDDASSELKTLLKGIPIWETYLKDIKGIGPTLGAILISQIDIEKAPTVSALWAYCFPAGQRVMTPHGTLPIESVEIGDEVLDRTGQWTEVVDTMAKNYAGTLLTIKAQRMKAIQCTGEHPFLVATRQGDGSYKEEWKPASALVVGEHFLVVPKLATEIAPPPIDVAATYMANNRKSGERKFPMTVTAFKLYGRFVANGATTLYKEGKYDRGRIMMAFGNGKEYESYAKILREEFGVRPGLVGRGNYNCVYLDFGRLGLARAFNDQFGDYSHTKRIPNWIMDAPRKFVQAFLDGYMEGDGCRGGEKRDWDAMNSVSIDLISQLQVLWTKVGSLAAWSEHLRGGTVIEIQPGKPCVVRDRYNLRINHPGHDGKVVDAGRAFYTPVASVSHEEFEGTVYNLTTASHTYCVHGVTTHNCGFSVDTATGRAVKRERGKALSHNPFLKAKLMEVLGKGFLKANNEEYRKIYDDRKNFRNSQRVPVCMGCDGTGKTVRVDREAEFEAGVKKPRNKIECPNCAGTGKNAPWGAGDAHREVDSRRYMVKMFLLRFWVNYRTLEGLEVREPYSVEKLGLVHHHKTTGLPVKVTDYVTLGDPTTPDKKTPRKKRASRKKAEAAVPASS